MSRFALPVYQLTVYHPDREKDLRARMKIVLARSLGHELNSEAPAAMTAAPMINDGASKAAIGGIRT